MKRYVEVDGGDRYISFCFRMLMFVTSVVLYRGIEFSGYFGVREKNFVG